MRLRRLLVLLAATLLLMSGCGGDNPEPKPMPKPSSTTSASSSPTPPAMPEAAKQKSKQGAIAFTRVFIETINYAGASGRTTPLRDLYIPHCTRCEALADGIDKTYSAGGEFEGGGWTPTQFKFYGIRRGVAFVDAIVDYAPQTWRPSRSAAPKHFPASKRNLKAFNLRWVNHGWKVSALDPNR